MSKISTSKSKNIMAIIKKGTEKDTLDETKEVNPHSNGLPFSESEAPVTILRKVASKKNKKTKKKTTRQ